MTELDIVIPVYNERDNILPVLDSLLDHVRSSFRVLICYDFDEDNTLAAIAGYKRLNELSVVNVKNFARGPHSAVVSGFRAATAPTVLVWPADDDYNAGAIDAMVAEIKGGASVVAGSRFIPGGSMRNCPWVKAFLVRASAFTLYHFARLPARDASNGLRMFSKKLLDSIQLESTQGFTYSIELLVKADRLGLKISEVPVNWNQRKAGESRFKVFKWALPYLRWYFYAFGNNWHRRPQTQKRET